MNRTSGSRFVAADDYEPGGGAVAVAADEGEGVAGRDDGSVHWFAVLEGGGAPLARPGEVNLNGASVRKA